MEKQAPKMDSADVARFTVVIPAALYERVKIAAIHQRRPVKTLVATCLERCLDNPPAQPDRTGGTRAPYPEADSSSGSRDGGG